MEQPIKKIVLPPITFILIVLSNLLLGSCNNETKANKTHLKTDKSDVTQVTYNENRLSYNKNLYSGFDSPKAINHIVSIENEYFKDVESDYSRYYGTQWLSNQFDSSLVFEQYINQTKWTPSELDSLHCTIYAIKGLKAGLGDSSFQVLDKYHKEIWKNREYAGWSIAYLLTKHFGWKAYLFISEYSNEYDICKKSFFINKSYPVWKQPNIPLIDMINLDTQNSLVDSLLNQNEFGWGFSEQGWHTWITRYDTLKECNWTGTPSMKLTPNSNYLFLKSKFTEYGFYNSHVIAFPPKE